MIKNKPILIGVLLLLATVAIGQNANKAKMKNVPLIDRSIFFGNPEIAGGQLSPDGKWISFLKEHEGIMNIWIKKFDDPFEKATLLTNNERPIGGYFWSYDSEYILFIKDKGGNENYHVFAVNPDGKIGEDGIPEARDLTPNEKVRAIIYQTSQKDPNIMMVGLNDRDPAYHDLYQLEIDSGKLTLLFENTEKISSWGFDWDENLRLAYKSMEDGGTQILRINEDKSFTPIYEHGPLESAYTSNWTKDNKKVYLISNKGDVNLSQLYLMDPETKEITFVEKDPENKVDFGGLSFSDNTREMVLTAYTGAKTRRYWKSEEWKKTFDYLSSKFPGREISFGSSTKDENEFLITVYGDRYVSDRYYFNKTTKELIHQYTPRPELKKFEKYLAPMEPITYKSSDGLEIPAYLTLPRHQTTKKLPLVMLVHGGPWSRDTWGYSSYAQFLANRGFVVLQPNFRGSTGYGKAFLNAGNMQWGMKMQDDITWGVKYLVNKGIVDESKVAIYGGSYGGYAALAGVTYTPDVYACSVDIVGPSNLFTLLESIPAYWESFRKTMYLRMGDPNTEEGKKILKKESPLFFADKIKTPLMIVQGANDPRVKQAESDQIVIALRELGTDVEYILAEDEGHGFRKPVNRMAMIAANEKFMAKYCGTRYQEDMPEEVSKRLKEMTVDIRTVTYEPPKKVTIAKSIPVIDTELANGSYDYDITLEVNGQQIAMTQNTSIEKVGNNWEVADKIISPMGTAADKVTYSTNDLAPIQRSFEQGPQKIGISYSEEDIKVTMMGKENTIAKNGAFLPEGAGFYHVLSKLPLEEGYQLEFNTLDLMTQKTKVVSLKVEGEETINDVVCKKVVLTNPENDKEHQTLYIDTKRNIAVKTIKKSPMMGGIIQTAILK